MLTTPRPIKPEIDADWANALCTAQARLDSTATDDYRLMFMGGNQTDGYPPRWGYYVGYRLAQRLLQDRPLTELAHLRPAEAEPLLKAELTAMIAEGPPCPS